MAILRRAGAGRWETFQPSQMPLGAWIQRPGLPIEPLLAGLTRGLPGFAFMLSVTQQDPDVLPRPKEGPRLTTLDYIQTARITINQTFDAYWEARGKNLKHNMKKQRSRLEKEGVKTSLEVISRPDEIIRAIENYGELEAAGWKAEGGTAIAPANVQGRFYRAMLENFCRQGNGRVYQYLFNDRVVAVDLCVEGNGSLIILKTTYDESIKNSSPAFLMRQEAFRPLFAEGPIRRIEFYGKLMEWHTRWSDEVRTLYHINYHRWAAVSTARRLIRKAPGLFQLRLRNNVAHKPSATKASPGGEAQQVGLSKNITALSSRSRAR
jgi:hypothetical protein